MGTMRKFENYMGQNVYEFGLCTYTYLVYAAKRPVSPSAEELHKDIATTAIIKTEHRVNSKAFFKDLAEVERDMGIRFNYYENANGGTAGRKVLKYHGI